jgi:hypothetical protein
MYTICLHDFKNYTEVFGFLCFLMILYGFVKINKGHIPPIRSPYLENLNIESDKSEEKIVRRSERIKNMKK